MAARWLIKGWTYKFACVYAYHPQDDGKTLPKLIFALKF